MTRCEDQDITEAKAQTHSEGLGVKVWPVGVLLRAIADALETRFNPVSVHGELSGFSRASSGHCYFSIKDEQGQIRCAMFRRTASLLDFAPRDGQRVVLSGRLSVYEPRGELQMVVESMRQAGQGNLFEQFVQLKNRLEAEGLFNSGRKRALLKMPASVGVVTSLGAAALHDVVTSLRRRAPHVRVIIYPAGVQGAQAAGEMCNALQQAYNRLEVDVLLLVRGGGAIDDLWAFNDEQLARTITQSPVPVISGIGHETDFTIADFCADVRAPTPTAAAELCAQSRQAWMDSLMQAFTQLRLAVGRQIETSLQRLDLAVARAAKPSHFITRQEALLATHNLNLRHAAQLASNQARAVLAAHQTGFPMVLGRAISAQNAHLQQLQLRLESLDPSRVLSRGYAWLTDSKGCTIASVKQTHSGLAVRATLVDGEVDLTVS